MGNFNFGKRGTESSTKQLLFSTTEKETPKYVPRLDRFDELVVKSTIYIQIGAAVKKKKVGRKRSYCLSNTETISI